MQSVASLITDPGVMSLICIRCIVTPSKKVVLSALLIVI